MDLSVHIDVNIAFAKFDGYIHSNCFFTSTFQSPIGALQVVSIDTTASLALELSVGMDTINENLNSLSEKVKSLKISIINSVSAMLLIS